MTTPSKRPAVRCLFVTSLIGLGAVLLLTRGPALAQTWDGGGADNNWTTLANWNPDGAPANNGTASVVMAGTVDPAPIVNAAQDILGLTFDNTAGAFTIAGSTLTVRTGGITNNDADTQTINTPITLQAAQTWNSAAGQLWFGGSSVTRNNFDLTIDGSFQTLIMNTIPGGGNLIKNGTGTLLLGGSVQGGIAINAGTLQITANDVLPYTDVFVGANATLNINGFTDTISFLNAISGTATVSLPTTSSLTVDGASIPLNGVISGDSTATFTKVSGNTLTLSGNNTFTGTYRVNAGTLGTGGNERLADSADVIVDGGFFNTQSFTETVDVITLKAGGIFNNTGGTLIGSAYNVESGFVQKNLGGSASLTKSTAGNVNIFTPSTYMGATNIVGGTLTLMNSEVLPNATAVAISPGGSLVLGIVGFQTETIGALSGSGNVTLGELNTLTVGGGDASSTFSGAISGNGNLTKVGGGTITLSGANTYSGATLITAGNVKLGANNVLADASDLTVNGATFDLQSFSDTVDIVTLTGGTIIGSGTLSASAFALQSGAVSASLGGSAPLTKTGAGTLTLGGANIYTGGTLINGGILEIGSDAGLGASGGGMSFNGGTLRTTSSFSLNRAVTLNPGGGTIDTLGVTTLNGTLGGAGGLTKAGLGTLVLNAVSTPLGALSVSAGDLELPIEGSLNVTGIATVGASGFFTADGGLITAGAFSNNGEIDLFNGAHLVGSVSNTGVISGDGRISGALANGSTAEIRIGANETLHIAGTSAHSNAGEIEVIAGELELDGPLTNSASTGLIFARNASLRFDGGLTNAGSVALSFGVTDLFGDINNQAAANIVISGGGDATFLDDVTNGGIIRVSAGSEAVFFGAVSGGGSFPGTGTIYFEGDLRPGTSPAQISFGGNVVLGSLSRTEIELAGTTPGTQHDQLVIAGQAALDGTLDVGLIDGFVPTGGDSFTIMTYGSHVGTFAAVNRPTVPGLRIRLRVDATSATILANFKGDMNCDGLLNVDDIPPFALALINPVAYGVTFATCDILIGDMNDDGFVDSLDVSKFVAALLDS